MITDRNFCGMVCPPFTVIFIVILNRDICLSRDTNINMSKQKRLFREYTKDSVQETQLLILSDRHGCVLVLSRRLHCAVHQHFLTSNPNLRKSRYLLNTKRDNISFKKTKRDNISYILSYILPSQRDSKILVSYIAGGMSWGRCGGKVEHSNPVNHVNCMSQTRYRYFEVYETWVPTCSQHTAPNS
jgi:hypothetical protein